MVTNCVVHIEVMGKEWSQNMEGQSQMVQRLPKILRKMLGKDATLPDFAFTDRGPGFYNSGTGTICRDYARALAEAGLKPSLGQVSKGSGNPQTSPTCSFTKP